MSMMELEVSRPEETFKNVIALYTALIENRPNMRVKQVEINMNGEVTAEPMDFLFDVEKKAKRVLTPREYTLFSVYSANGVPQLIPAEAQVKLGTVWYENELDIDGPYRSLYFRIKNRMDRERFSSEPGTSDTDEYGTDYDINGTDTLTTGD